MGPSRDTRFSWLGKVSLRGERFPNAIPAAAATAGATVGAEGVIVELGENANFNVYDPPPEYR